MPIAVLRIKSTVLSAVAESSNVVELFQDQNNLIPSNEFKVFIGHLDQNRNSYSSKSRDLIDEIKTLLKDAMDGYFKSTDLISEWCGFARNQLQRYLSIVGFKENIIAKSKHKLIVDMLEVGLQKVTAAQAKLEEVSRNFNGASGRILALTAQMNADFDQQSYEMKKNTKNLGIASIFAKLCFFCPIPASLPIDQLIRTLQTSFDKAKAYHEELKVALQNADRKISQTKDKVKKEIQAMGNVKTQAHVSLDTINDVIDIGELDNVIRKEIEIPIGKLIEQCRIYQQQHNNQKESYY